MELKNLKNYKLLRQFLKKNLTTQVIGKMSLIKWWPVASIIVLSFAFYSFFAQTKTLSINTGTSYGDKSTAIGTNTGTVNINTENSTKSELPKFEGEFGHYELSKRFTNFIFDNQRKPVYIDAYYVPNDDEIEIVNNTFGVDGFQLWDSCESLAPNEKPSYIKCTGTYFTLDRSGTNKDKDSDITYIRGTLRVHGYFTIRGCDGPHQGSMGCMLRPLNPEEVHFFRQY